jgi:RimJ/RimL family protein N-acetyltransferase
MIKAIILRAATLKDADILFSWRNHPITRKSSHSTAELNKDEHITWLSRMLANTSQKIMIAEQNGLAVGTVRGDYSKGICKLSWTVAPLSQGQGIAKYMVALFAANITQPIEAEIKIDNIASIRVAEYAGMTLDDEKSGVFLYGRASLN